jgi:hypothetical protein
VADPRLMELRDGAVMVGIDGNRDVMPLTSMLGMESVGSDDIVGKMFVTLASIGPSEEEVPRSDAPGRKVVMEPRRVTLSEVLGKLGSAVTDPRDILSPVGIVRDRLRPLRDPVSDSVGKIGDGVCEPRDGITELSVGMVRSEVRDTAGKVTDKLGTLKNERNWNKSVIHIFLTRGSFYIPVMWESAS